MGCYKDSTKAACAKVVIGISVVLGLLGLICVIVGVIQMGVVKPPQTDNIDF